MGALGAGLALPFSLAMAASPAASRDAALAAQQGFQALAESSSLARWHDYALASITPRFSWALRPEAVQAPAVLDSYSGRLAHAPRLDLPTFVPTSLSISIDTATVAETPTALPDRTGEVTRMQQPGLQRTVITPTLSRDFGEHGRLRLTGVLAYQRFASLELGTASTGWAVRPAWVGDSGYGAGARIELGDALGERWRWNVGYQSRVAMGSFANYRGVLAEPGRFDIPASASATLSYALTPGFSLNLGVQRIMFSSITPFTSENLPRRFLALLGDSSSPAFAWQDLDVYSAGWSWQTAQAGAFDLRYTTRQQPLPTSRLLERALSGGIADRVTELGWSRDFGTATHVALAARYANSPYYLMMPTWQSVPGAMAGRFEFEALWLTRF
ncbi:MAG: hypothetical protein J0H15_03860 [Xanthomonadales bacterium]|nr:hypothetical protein [Xanthomonadales bacterium]